MAPPKKLILDATAGNRHIWGKDKFPENVVFMDKELNLRMPPDVIATWNKIPFPDNYFECVIFDPPQTIATGKSPIHHDPMERESGHGGGACWWGWFWSKGQMSREIYQAQKEFARVSSRLCFKWNDSLVDIDQILTLFDKWIVQFKQEFNSRTNRSKSKTWWIKMVRKPIGD